MEIIKMSATQRTQSGKNEAHRLRKTGSIPAVAYGKNLKATCVAVSPKDLMTVLSSEHGQNSVVELAIDGNDKLTVMVRDYSYHPISRELVHADFLQIHLDQPVDVDIPFRMTGKAKGVVTGGILQQVFRRIPVRCLPEKIPAFLEADVSELDLGESLKARDLKMPEGVKARLSEDQTVAVVAVPEKGGEEVAAVPGAAAPGAAPAAAAAAPAAGKAAAPAAAGKAAAAPAAAGKAAAPAAAGKAAAPAKPAAKK